MIISIVKSIVSVFSSLSVFVITTSAELSGLQNASWPSLINFNGFSHGKRNKTHPISSCHESPEIATLKWNDIAKTFAKHQFHYRIILEKKQKHIDPQLEAQRLHTTSASGWVWNERTVRRLDKIRNDSILRGGNGRQWNTREKYIYM